MYNPNKLSFSQKLTKKSIIYGTIISICLMLLTSFAPVHAFTNAFSALVTPANCTSCSNPITITDTAHNTNDLIVFVATCTSAFTISTMTDTISNSWSFGVTQNTQQTFLNNNVYSSHTGATTLYTFMGFTKALSTSASTLSITFSSAQSNCNYGTFDGNTVFTAYLSLFSNTPSYQSTSAVSNNIGSPYATTQSFPANSIILSLSSNIWVSSSTQNNVFALPPNGFVNFASGQTSLSDGACAVICNFWSLYGTFQTLTPVQSGIGFQLTNFESSGGGQQMNAIVGFVFNISGTITSTGTTQSQNLCTSTFTPTSGSTKTGNMISNYTYWSPLYNAIGIGSGNFITITNLTLWVGSISLTNSQTAVDIYILMFMPGGSFSPNNQPQLPSATTPWNTIFNYPSQTGAAQQAGKVLLISTQHFTNTANPFKISTPLAITSVAAGVSFAVGIYITHNGVNLVKCGGSYPQLYQQQVPSSVITNSGFNIQFGAGNLFSLGFLNTANQNGTTPYLYALINQPGTTTIQTATNTILTVTSFSTVTSTTTTGIATQTITTTTTVITNAFASPTGSAQIETNLVTYWPIWALPLIFGSLGGTFGFGTGGLLMGLMFGLILLQLDGQIPLWTVFIDIIMLYMLLRR